MRIAGQLALPASRLVVRLREDDDLACLEVRSRLDRTQSFLLPLTQQPILAGLSMSTRLSRLHAHAWALAYGTGRLPEKCLLRFESDGLRYRRTYDAVPQRMGERLWVADAEGIFATVAAVTADIETARVRLAVRW